MENVYNPYELIFKELNAMKIQNKKLLDRIDGKHLAKLYNIKEVALILRVSEQSVRLYIEKGLIKDNCIGTRKMIQHSEIYKLNGDIREFKYKRVS